MVLIMNQVIFPPDQSSKVAKRFVDWLKEHPPDKSLQKNLCIAVKSNEDGNGVAIGIGEVMKGKVQEVLQYTHQQNLYIASGLEGVKYKIDVMIDFKEAYKVLSMAPPPEV